MSQIFITLFYQPILNLLVFLYNIVPGHDIGIAIILMTIIIKLILMPLSKKSLESQKALQVLQPKIEKIKETYKENKEEMSKRIMALYAENKINPFSSCFPLLIQLPFLFAVFRVFRAGLTNGSLDLVYSFVNKPDSLNPISFGIINLSTPNVFLAVLTGIAQFFQARMMVSKKPEIKGKGSSDESMASAMNKQMLYFMPILTVFIGLSLPSGLSLYWFLTTILTILQQVFVFKSVEAKTSNDTVTVEGALVAEEIKSEEKPSLVKEVPSLVKDNIETDKK